MRKYLILIVTLVICSLYFLNLLEPLDEAILDLQCYLQKPGEYSDSVVVVAVDELSLVQVGQWPWSRKVIAELIDVITEYEPAVIGLDILLSDPGVDEDDQILAASIADAKNVVLPSYPKTLKRESTGLLGYEWILPLPELEQAAASVGHIVVLPSYNHRVRSLPAVVRFNEAVAISALSLELVQKWMPHGLADDFRNLLYLNFPSRDLPLTLSVIDVLTHKIDPELLKDKIVLVGVTAQGIQDFHGTVFHRAGVPGVHLHAVAVENLLTDNFLQRVPMILVIIILQVTAGAILVFQGKLPLLVAIGSCSGFMLVSFILFTRFNYWLDTAPLFLQLIAGGFIDFGHSYFAALKEKQYLQSVFQRYVSKDVLRQLSPRRVMPQLGGVRQNISVIFVDICGFTTFAEANEPEEVVETLNQYLGVISQQILSMEGMVDKYLGDGVMGIFGTPFAIKASAIRTLKTALIIQNEIEELNMRRTNANQKVLRCGIGIATGQAVLGNIGSEQRMEYTAIGDVVNLAHRIQAMAKDNQILIDDSTYRQLHDTPIQWSKECFMEGRTQPVTIYCVDYHLANITEHVI